MAGVRELDAAVGEQPQRRERGVGGRGRRLVEQLVGALQQAAEREVGRREGAEERVQMRLQERRRDPLAGDVAEQEMERFAGAAPAARTSTWSPETTPSGCQW